MASDRWSFEDDRQQEVVVADRPKRVLAYAQAAQTLSRLGAPVVGYFGSQHHADSGSQPSPTGLELPSVGAGDAVDLDQVAALQPDLVVSVTYAGEVYGVSADVAAKLADIAPVLLVRIAGDRTLDEIIRRFHELSQALAPDAAADSEAGLTSALARLTDAVSAHPAVRVAAISGGTPTDAYVANPAYWPSLRLLADAGVGFTANPAAGGWAVVKWDDLPSEHPADIVLYDQRANSLGKDTLATIPAWSQVPGVQTGNVLSWDPEPPLTYKAATTFVNTIREQLQGGPSTVADELQPHD